MPVRVAVEKVAGLVDVIMPLKMLRIALSAFAVGAKIAAQTERDKSNFLKFKTVLLRISASKTAASIEIIDRIGRRHVIAFEFLVHYFLK